MATTHYELEFTGDEIIITFLRPYIPEQFDFRREANAVRRAVAALFGEAVEAKVVSVRRIPARTRRRVLRI